MSHDREHTSSVDASRREVELRLAEVRESIGREIGLKPKTRNTLLALVAASAGFALAMGRRRKHRQKRHKKKRR